MNVPEEFSFSCPLCHQSLEAAVDLAGEAIECPGCGKTIEVPEHKAESQSGIAPEEVQKPADIAPDATNGQPQQWFNLACPTCAKTLRISTSKAGQSFECPRCKAPLECDIVQADGNPIVQGKKFLFATRKCINCGQQVSVAAVACTKCGTNQKTGAKDQAQNSANTNDAKGASKACPFCAEPILAAAIKCKHCGSPLLKAEQPAKLHLPTASKDASAPLANKKATAGGVISIIIICFAVFCFSRLSCNSTSAEKKESSDYLEGWGDGRGYASQRPEMGPEATTRACWADMATAEAASYHKNKADYEKGFKNGWFGQKGMLLPE